MAKVTNNHVAPLTVGSVQIRPCATAKVAGFERVKDNATIRAWLDAGVISVDAKAEKPKQPKPTFEPVDDEREAIIADLEELGVKVDRRKSTETLEAELSDVLELHDAGDSED